MDRPVRWLIRQTIARARKIRKHFWRPGGAGKFLQGIFSGHSVRIIRDLDELPATDLFRFPPSHEKEISPTHPIGGFAAPEKIGSRQVRIFKAKNIVFEPDSELLLFDRKLYLQRLKKSVAPKSGEDLSSPGGLVAWNNQHLSLCREKKLSELPSYDSGIVVNGFFSTNWYHWLVSHCARGWMVEESGAIPADVPWFLPEAVRGSQQESLFRLLVGNEREAEFVPFGPVRVAEAFLIENPARELRKPLNWSELTFREIGEFHWEIFNGMRQKALDSIDRLLPSRHGERLFLTREQTTRPFNQKELVEIAVEFGFVPVDPSSLSAVEQVRLFADAKFIVSSTGAQWSGLMFAERARCLTLITEFLSAHTVFSKLATLGGSTIFELEMESPVREWKKFYGTKVESKVDPPDFRKSLEDLLSLD